MQEAARRGGKVSLADLPALLDATAGAVPQHIKLLTGFGYGDVEPLIKRIVSKSRNSSKPPSLRPQIVGVTGKVGVVFVADATTSGYAMGWA